MDARVLQGTPQALNEDIVEEAAAPIHRDSHPGLLQPLRPRPRRELAALVGVEYLWRAMPVENLVQRIDAELHVHGVRQTPGQNLAAPPVHDRHQV